MTDDEIISAFADLFEGNHLRYGTEGGGSVSAPAPWPYVAGEHLKGRSLLSGVYPIDPESGLCKWGCIDFDEGEDISLVHARNVQLVLSEFGIVGHLERSRSKGFHAWVFAGSWGPAATMRNALLAACELVDAPTAEINPKQTKLADGQVGNYVRLPYPNGLSDYWRIGEEHLPHRRVMLDAKGKDIPLRPWLREVVLTRTEERQLQELAALHKPSRPERPTVYTVPSRNYNGTTIERLKPLTRWIYYHGPADGTDRSSALWKFACLMAEDGRHTRDEALSLLTEADELWGKFRDRADGELRLEELLDKAWADRAVVYEVGTV